MKITIEINTDPNFNYFSEAQAETVREELENIVRRFSDPEFYNRTRKAANLKPEEPLVGQVGFTHYDVLIKHTVEVASK